MPTNSHSAMGPSSLERRQLCPGSYHMEAAVTAPAPKDGPGDCSPAANRGRQLHAVLALLLGVLYGGKANHDTVAQQALRALESYDRTAIDYCLRAVATGLGESGYAEYVIEKDLDLKAIHPAIDHGTLDFAAINPLHGVLFDFKFGSNPVTLAADNVQLATYAAGLARAYGLQTVHVWLVQPALEVFDGYLHTELRTVETQLHAIAYSALKPDAMLIPGEKQCRYCKAAGTCAARAEKLLMPMTVKVKDQPTAALPLVKHLTNAQKASIWAMSSDVKRFLADVETALQAELEAGAQVPGVALGPGRETRVWLVPDPAAALATVAAELKLDATVITESNVASPAAIEKAWGRSKAVRQRLEKLLGYKAGAQRVVKA